MTKHLMCIICTKYEVSMFIPVARRRARRTKHDCIKIESVVRLSEQVSDRHGDWPSAYFVHWLHVYKYGDSALFFAKRCIPCNVKEISSFANY